MDLCLIQCGIILIPQEPAKYMEKNSLRPSAFEIYLSSPEVKEKFSKSEIVIIDKDEKEGFMHIDFRIPETPGYEKVIDTHEVFLNKSGKPIVTRVMLRDPYAKYPIVRIEGIKGDLEYLISRGIQGGPIIDDKLYNEGFFMNFELITQSINYRIQYDLRYGYHGVNELEVIFCQDKEGKISDLENPKLRFVGIENTVWVDEERDPLSSTALNQQVVHPQTNFSFRLEKEKLSRRAYKYSMFVKDPSTGKESVLTLPNWIDVEDWDRKVRAPDRSWKDLWKEMPIAFSVNG